MNPSVSMHSFQSPKTNRARSKKGLLAGAAFLLLMMASTSQSSAQSSLQLGLKAGANFFKEGGRSWDGKYYPGFNGGVYSELNFSSYWGIQTELLYNMVIAKTGQGFNDIYTGASTVQITNSYIALPVMLAFRPVPELSILIGPQYGYLFAQTTELLPNDKSKKVFNKSDLSLVFGGQLNLGKVKLGARYSAGLNNINGINTTDTWRQYGYQVYLGYQIKDIKLKKKK